jgi:NAD(P)-dependent dehydrogenase (short-subunit alcohol dehydrogenase family)
MGSAQRKVVVVGAGSGIGAATARYFHERGDHVLAVDVRAHDAPASEYLLCDLRDAEAISQLLGRIGPGWDLLAHVAGIPGTAPAADVLKVNYLGLRLMAEGILPLLRQGGAIVAVASTAGLAWSQRAEHLAALLDATDAEAVEQWQADQNPAYPVYSTSKEAAILYAKRLARPAWAKFGVRVNTVSPGPIETPILPDFERTMGKETLDAVRTMVGRHGTVEDVVPVIAFLGSPEAGWINGQDIQVDCGFISSITSGAPIEL